MRYTKRQLLIFFILTAIVSSLMIGVANAETFTVSPFQEVTRSLGLNARDKVTGIISVRGGGGNDVDFYVTDPNGNTILRRNRVTHTSFSFTASTTGTYTLHFDNSFSWFSSKTVTLNYSIGKPMSLVPWSFLFFLIVAIIIVVVVAIVAVVYAVTKRKPAPKKAIAPISQPQPITRICPKCGQVLTEEAKFCPKCGKKLG